MKIPTCKCGADKWMGIPDALAWTCKNCLAVITPESDGSWTYGADLRQWAKDIYDSKKAKENG